MNKKSICIVLHSDAVGGGIQTRRAMLASQWINFGCDVTVICLKHENNTKKSLTFPGETIYLGVPNIRNVFAQIFSLKPLISIFRNRQFDAILAGETFTIASTALALRLSRNTSPFYASLHNPFYEGLDRFPYAVANIIKIGQRALIGFALSKARGIIAISQGVLETYNRAVPSAMSNTKVIYNPVVDSDIYKRLELTQNDTLDRETPTIQAVAIGRLSYQKGFDRLINAVARCKVNCEVRIYGDGPLRTNLEKLICECKLTDKIFLMGLTDNPIAAIQSGNLFVLPSRWEGLGNVLVEALYCNKPIVAYDCPGGVREVLANGRYGTLVESGNIDMLARAMEETWTKKNNNIRWKDFESKGVAEEYLYFMGLSGKTIFLNQ